MGRVILALALAVLLAAVVVACGGSSSDASSTAPAPAATETAAPVETSTPADTSTPGAPSTGEVAALYADNCSGCHGADGSGGSGPALTGEDDLDEVRARIENGGGPMPAFSGQMPPGQIDALAQYVVGGLQ